MNQSPKKKQKQEQSQLGPFYKSLIKTLSGFHDLINNKINQGIPQKMLLIIGPAGTGKTSFLNYVNKSDLECQQDDLGNSMLKPLNMNQNIYSFPFSCENENEKNYSLEMQLNFSINKDEQNSILIVQIPELVFDSQEEELQIQKDTKSVIKLLLGNIIKYVDSIHIVFTIESNQLDNGSVLKLNYEKFMNPILVSEDSLELLKQSISVVLTKGQEKDDSPIYQFQDIIKDLQNQQEQVGNSFSKYLSDANQNQRVHLFSKAPDSSEGQKLLETIKSSNFISSQKISLSIFNIKANSIQRMCKSFTQILRQSLVKLSDLLKQINLIILIQQNTNKVFSLKQHRKQIVQYFRLYNKFIKNYFELIKKRPGKGSVNIVQLQKQKEVVQQRYDIMFVKQLLDYISQIKQLPVMFDKKFKQKINQILLKAKACYQFFRYRQMEPKQISSVIDEVIKLKAFCPQQMKKMLQNTAINQLCNNEELLSLTQLKQQLNQVKKIARTRSKENERTYQDIRKQFQNMSLQRIMQKLPNKILKFDFLHVQLNKIAKKQQQVQQNGSQSNFYQMKILITQIVKILEIQALHEEALMFMMVIPDFNHIQQILNEAIYYKSSNDPKVDQFAPKFQFSIELLTRIEKFCEFNLRDSIALKCVQLKTQRSQKSAAVDKKRQQLKDSLKKRIENKKSQLEKDKLAFTMNFKNHGHDDILSQDFRKKIIEKGMRVQQKNNEYLFLFQYLKKYMIP